MTMLRSLRNLVVKGKAATKAIRLIRPRPVNAARLLRWQRGSLTKSALGTGTEPGATCLGKTQSAKDVTVSGADCRGYTDQDHRDAARLHAQAHVYHDTRAYAYRRHGEVEEDLEKAAALFREADRHGTLAIHHHGRMDAHLAVFRAAAERHGARQVLSYRTFQMYPGGLTEQDQAAYAGFTLTPVEG